MNIMIICIWTFLPVLIKYIKVENILFVSITLTFYLIMNDFINWQGQ